MSIMISMLRSRSEHVVKLSNEFVSWCHKYEGTTDKQGHEHRYIWDRKQFPVPCNVSHSLWIWFL